MFRCYQNLKQKLSHLSSWKFESSKTKVPRRRIYDCCIKKDEEKINFLECEWKPRGQNGDVTSRWYEIGIMAQDEESDQDDNDEEHPGSDNDNDDSHGFSGSESDDNDRPRYQMPNGVGVIRVNGRLHQNFSPPEPVTDTDTENEDEPDDYMEHLDPMPENFQLDEIEG